MPSTIKWDWKDQSNFLTLGFIFQKWLLILTENQKYSTMTTGFSGLVWNKLVCSSKELRLDITLKCGQSFRQSINHLSHQFIDQLINLKFIQVISQLISQYNQFIIQSNIQSISQSINQSIIFWNNQSFNQSINWSLNTNHRDTQLPLI